MIPDPWNTPTQYPQSPLYSSLQSGRPELFENLLNVGRKAKERATEAGTQIASRGGQAAQAIARRPGLTGTLGTTAVLAGGNILQQDLLGTLSSAAGGLAGGGIGAGIAKFIPGPVGKVAQVGLPIIGSLLGGMGVEQATQAFAGRAQETGQRPGAGADVEIANVPLTETAAARKQIEFEGDMRRQQILKDLQTLGPAEIAQAKEAYQMMMEMGVQQEKAMLPLRERMQRTQLVNQQAINASNASLYQQMGRSAVMGRMAQQAQVEAGATTRTLLSQNPYAGAVLQAPSVSFG